MPLECGRVRRCCRTESFTSLQSGDGMNICFRLPVYLATGSFLLWFNFTNQRSACTVIYLNHYITAFVQRVLFFWKNHHFVLAGTSHPVLVATFTVSFNQYFKCFAQVLLVTFTAQRILQFHDLIQPLFLYLFRHIVFIPACRQG